MTKKISIIAAILAIIITAGITVYITLSQEGREEERPAIPQSDLTPISPSEPVDISNWKVYRNAEYGFEVKYPEGWERRDRSYQDCSSGGCNFSIGITSPIPTAWIGIKVYHNYEQLSLENWLNTFISPDTIRRSEHIDYFTLEEVDIGPEKGLRIIYHPIEKPYRHDIIYLAKGDFIYSILLPGYQQTSDMNETVKQIIFTFRFIE